MAQVKANNIQATTLGLAAVALTNNPAYPTYPDDMTTSQVSSGLSAPFAAVALLGNHGAVALLLTLFMAVTSSSSAELIAVSSVFTFDVYKMYMNPLASPEQLIRVSHIMICVFGVVMAMFACIWNAIGIDLGWLFLTMGLLIGGAVFPAALTVCWKKQSSNGALFGALGGLSAGLTAWLVTAKALYGELTITTTGSSYPTLAGNLASVLTGLGLTLVISSIKPDNFDWEVTRGINAPATEGMPSSEPSSGEQSPPSGVQDWEKHAACTENKNPPNLTHNTSCQIKNEEQREALEDEAILEDPTLLRGAFRFAVVSSIILTLLMDFIIPMPMFFSHYIFSKGFFIGWIVISFIWVFCSLAICALLPIWEAKTFFVDFWKEVVDGRRQRKMVVAGRS